MVSDDKLELLVCAGECLGARGEVVAGFYGVG
jgi:hypothetical protein